MPHYEILSPLAAPLTYVLFAVTWISCIICVVVSIYFYRTKRQAWWLLIALAMALPLIFEVTMALSHGLPPLPYRLDYPPQKLAAVSIPEPDEPLTTGSSGVIEYSVSRVQWSFGPPLIAAALIWAYREDKRKRG